MNHQYGLRCESLVGASLVLSRSQILLGIHLGLRGSFCDKKELQNAMIQTNDSGISYNFAMHYGLILSVQKYIK